MKEIKAIFRPAKLLAVTGRLQEIPGLPGLAISEIRGIGKAGAPAREGDEPEDLEYVHWIKLEVVVDDAMVDGVVYAIQRYAHTGNPGDGKIFVSTIDDVVKIRTNERGPQAI